MARVKGIKRVNTFLRNVLKNPVTNKQRLEDIGEFIKDRIFKFTKSGKSIAFETPRPLKPLSFEYIQQRRRLKGKKGKLFSPEFSNLTLTGQMLDSLKVFIDDQKNSVEVRPTGKRRRERLTNEKLAEFVAKQGRPFIGLDKDGVKRVKRIILDDIRRNIRRFGIASK